MDKNTKRKPASKRKENESLLDYLHDLIYILAAVILLCLIFFRIVVVSGSSMYKTLLDGDYLLLISNMLYQQPEQGDIIVASKKSFDGGRPIVKRVIATEGQTVDIEFEAGIVYVDGNALAEDYTYTPTNLDEGVSFPLVVEQGHVFVLGDNRNHSRDSRSVDIGLIDKREILGKAVVLFLPGTNGGKADRDFARIGVLGS